MPEVNIKDIDVIVKNTVAAVEQGKEQIYDIYEAARKETDHVTQDLEQVRQRLIHIILRVDELESLERRARIKLMEVSRNFSTCHETDIKKAYQDANNLQIELAVAREQEQNLRQSRDDLQIRLKQLKTTSDKAEQLTSQLGAALGFLSNKMGAVIGTLETLQQRQQFGAKIIQAQEEERCRVSREIHDGPAQDMANLVFRAEVCERLVDTDPNRCKNELADLREQVRFCLKETRKIIFDLRPMTLDDLGLVPTIRRILDGLHGRSKVNTEIQVLGEERRIRSYIEVGLFRIIQEALNNVEKHAEASYVRVMIEFTPASIQAVVQDDGQGFEKGEKIDSDHFGLMGMDERSSLLGGILNIQSKPGRGTKVSIKIGLAEEQ